MAVTKVSGLDEIISNLNKKISKLKGNVQKGLTLAMLEIKGKSMDKTPVDVGNLRSSHYLVSGDGTKNTQSNFRPDKKGSNKVAQEHLGHVNEAASNARSQNRPFAEIGCTAFYAVDVHEDLEARHTTGGCKFLERAITEGQGKILSTVKRFAKL